MKLSEAENYGRELTPAENRRRLARARAEVPSRSGSRPGDLPGQSAAPGGGPMRKKIREEAAERKA
jgi:hypothetical protein